ncbi:MAG TPA: COX15/CtaA family protein, partial [Anaerolineales bacterium]|nr:COX15/CtaA family protein [Anaerolineales bacterium]
AVWTALGHIYGFTNTNRRSVPFSTASKLATLSTLGLLLQMAYGAFNAGLKAGHVSDTWPLMLGRWMPQDLLNQIQPPALNLVAAPLTVAFIHRWLAFILLVFVGVALYVIGRLSLESGLRKVLRWIAALSALQIGLGIAVVVSRVSIAVALLHQANALALFVLAVYSLHRLRNRDAIAAA